MSSFLNIVRTKFAPFNNWALINRNFTTFARISDALENEGFEAERQKGSHVYFYKNEFRVTVPDHGKKDLADGTIASIIRQAEKAGVDRKKFKKDIGIGGR